MLVKGKRVHHMALFDCILGVEGIYGIVTYYLRHYGDCVNIQPCGNGSMRQRSDTTFV
jgi:hypothetical protein